MDTALCAEVLGLPAASRYGRLGLQLADGGLQAALTLSEGCRGLFAGDLLAELEHAAGEVAASRQGSAAAGLTEEQCLRALVAFQSNAWRGEGCALLYARICRMNHSCRPNVSVDTGCGRAAVTALRPIAPGEELTASYAAAEVLWCSLAERRQILAETWGFWCRCSRCLSEEADAEAHH
mmetsp:Transcript_118369/g.330145  ORF Transcript_118369/g.330145 Transcript_118369/m.330145 type:complete len:180 (+) Transcript_118369:267-806(+)